MHKIIVDRFKESGKWYTRETIEIPKSLKEFEYPDYIRELYPISTTGFITIFAETQKDKTLINCPILIHL